jgi:serine/threonine protein kinase
LSNFSHSIFYDPNHRPTDRPESCHTHYNAPECFDCGNYTPAIDVFSFGLILYEMIVGFPAISRDLTREEALCRIVVGGPIIVPTCMRSEIRSLISEWLSISAEDRPTFDDILDRLRSIRSGIFDRVDFKKMNSFVETILCYESTLDCFWKEREGEREYRYLTLYVNQLRKMSVSLY